MFEGLAPRREKQIREMNRELGLYGLSLYGAGSLLDQAQMPDGFWLTVVSTAAAVVAYRWLDRRWSLEDLDGAR